MRVTDPPGLVGLVLLAIVTSLPASASDAANEAAERYRLDMAATRKDCEHLEESVYRGLALEPLELPGPGEEGDVAILSYTGRLGPSYALKVDLQTGVARALAWYRSEGWL